MILSEEQNEALQRLEKFVKDDTKILVLQGYAGVGKSFVMREYVQYLDSNDIAFTLCAPTHKAALILREVTNYSTTTLHSLLGLKPNMEIFHLDYKDLKFNVGQSKIEFPSKSIIIIDEASMINDSMYKLLLDLIKVFESKILFIGDKCQLAPVNNGGTSLVFDDNEKITLTKIFRQSEDSKLYDLLFKLRKNYVRKFDPIENTLFIYKNAKDFMYNSINDFKLALNTQNFNHVKLIAYTNKRVQGFNNCIRKLLNFKKPYNKFEFLTGYENFEYNNYSFFNSMDYVIIEEPKYVTKKLPEFKEVKGFELVLYDKLFECSSEIFIIDEDTDLLESLAYTIESIRLEALECKIAGSRFRASAKWKEYFKLIKSFATPIDLYWDNRIIKKKTFDYGYAITAHKAQGTSLDTVYIDMNNFNICPSEAELRQLQYVALSRTKTTAHLLI